MGYYDDDKKHPVRRSKARPRIDAPISVLEYTTKVLGKPAAEKRKTRRRLERLHAIDVEKGKGGWLTRIAGKGPYFIRVSEYGRVHPEELAGGQEESLEDRVRRLERKVGEVGRLRERVKSLETQVDALNGTNAAHLRALKLLNDRMSEIATNAGPPRKKR